MKVLMLNGVTAIHVSCKVSFTLGAIENTNPLSTLSPLITLTSDIPLFIHVQAVDRCVNLTDACGVAALLTALTVSNWCIFT